jgi:hypothetical protein
MMRPAGRKFKKKEEKKMLEKIRSMMERKPEELPNLEIKISTLRQAKGNGKSPKAFFDVEVPGNIVIRNFAIMKSPITGLHYASPPCWRFEDPVTEDVVYKKVVLLPPDLMNQIEIQALQAWGGGVR